ncbi:MAG TPA: manganese efflux pump [Candidatus Baltobacteraceae bacterium]|nr:manganese efflux pump [Candidatus Baltobacteraceae bacterium]
MSVGVGVRGASTAAKIRIGAAFASAEIAMNCIGAGLGLAVGRVIGDGAAYLGYVALVAVGVYMTIEARRNLGDRPALELDSGWGLLLASLGISLDSLGIGFSILYIGVPLVVALVTIGVVSVLATTLGLSLGRALGTRVEDAAETLGGVLLALTGAAFIALKALHAG